MQALIEDVVDGRLGEGQWLPREVDLAARFGVSRGVARETIRALEERGVVRVRHGRGAEVMGEARWNVFDPDVLQAMLANPGRSALLADILESRRLLEGEVAERAAGRARPADVDALATALEAVDQAAKRPRRPAAADDELVHSEVEFHRALGDIAGNRALAQMLEPVHLATATARHALVDDPGRATVAYHRRIASAVEAGDAPAARAAVEKDAAGLIRLAKRSGS